LKFQASPTFRTDYEKLSDDEKQLFKAAVRELNQAYARRGDRPLPDWPGNLRVKAVRDADGVFEMTWSYRRPDGRATFEFIDLGDEPAIRWRRVGDHRIFQNP
jgi:hypothetical protein